MTRSIQISLKPAAGVMLHLYRDDGMMANIQIAILCIMPLLQDLNVNFVANNNKCLFSWNSAQ